VLQLLAKRHHDLIAARTRAICRLHTTVCSSRATCHAAYGPTGPSGTLPGSNRRPRSTLNARCSPASCWRRCAGWTASSPTTSSASETPTRRAPRSPNCTASGRSSPPTCSATAVIPAASRPPATTPATTPPPRSKPPASRGHQRGRRRPTSDSAAPSQRRLSLDRGGPHAPGPAGRTSDEILSNGDSADRVTLAVGGAYIWICVAWRPAGQARMACGRGRTPSGAAETGWSTVPVAGGRGKFTRLGQARRLGRRVWKPYTPNERQTA
jgi:hypothetical protein